MSKVDRSKNRIVCAANRYANGTLIVGPRHFDETMRATMQLLNPDWSYWKQLGHVQGFIDKFGKFHGREAAWIIAEEAGQIWDRCGGDGAELFSENLY